jgi:hypothetical protein
MNETEAMFVRKHRELHALAKEATALRITLVEAYMQAHYPDIAYEVIAAEDNALAADFVFHGLNKAYSSSIMGEVKAYLQSLLASQ